MDFRYSGDWTAWNARWEGSTLSMEGHAHFRYGTFSAQARPIIHGGRSLIVYSKYWRDCVRKQMSSRNSKTHIILFQVNIIHIHLSILKSMHAWWYTAVTLCNIINNVVIAQSNPYVPIIDKISEGEWHEITIDIGTYLYVVDMNIKYPRQLFVPFLYTHFLCMYSHHGLSKDYSHP